MRRTHLSLGTGLVLLLSVLAAGGVSASNGPNQFGFRAEPIAGQEDNVLVVTLAPQGGPPVARACVPILDDPYEVDLTQATTMPGDGNPCGPATPEADLAPGMYTNVAAVYKPGSQDAIRLVSFEIEMTGPYGIEYQDYQLSAFPGDTDCDYDADAVDALYVLRGVAALSVTASCTGSGDVDCSGGRTAVDALGILRYVAGLPALSTPPGCLPVGPTVPLPF